MPETINKNDQPNEVPVSYSNADLKQAHAKRMKELKAKETKSSKTSKK